MSGDDTASRGVQADKLGVALWGQSMRRNYTSLPAMASGLHDTDRGIDSKLLVQQNYPQAGSKFLESNIYSTLSARYFHCSLRLPCFRVPQSPSLNR